MKYFSKIIRIILIFFCGLSIYLLLLSSASLHINNTHEMATILVDKTAKKTENKQLKAGIKFLKDSGLEEVLINGIPKDLTLKFSYADVYHLTSEYDQKGKISAKDLNLKANNKIEKLINNYVVNVINYKLSEESQQVYHLISIYRYSIFAIILVYVLAVVLIWLKRYSASIPLLVGSIVSFGALQYFCREASFALQKQVYEGISIKLDLGIWLGLIIGVLLAVIWPVILKYIKKVESLNA